MVEIISDGALSQGNTVGGFQINKNLAVKVVVVISYAGGF